VLLLRQSAFFLAFSGSVAFDPTSPHAGAGAALSQAMSIINFSRRLVSDHCSTVLGIASVRMKLPRL
jgi:hypothetical protein